MVALLGEAAYRRYGATKTGRRREGRVGPLKAVSPTSLAAGRGPGRQDTPRERPASVRADARGLTWMNRRGRAGRPRRSHWEEPSAQQGQAHRGRAEGKVASQGPAYARAAQPGCE